MSHMSGIEFVRRYLYRTKGVFESSFMTLLVTQGEHSEPVLEKYIKDWEQTAATDPTADHAQKWIRYWQYNLDSIDDERSIYGDDFLHMACAAVAASIISTAYLGVMLGEQRGKIADGRMVHDPYRLRQFLKLSRDHGAHFWEDVTKDRAHADRRLAFQKEVLRYDQEADGTNINHSVALLDKLGWHWYKDVEDDLINLFDPTWKSNQG
jgi:hypothetical protein